MTDTVTPEQIANLRAWVAALRSESYGQTRQFLHGATGYCCLGVLCDLEAASGRGRWNDADDYVAPWGESYSDLPPTSVAARYGVTRRDDARRAFTTAGERRDGRPWTIEGIAYTDLAVANDAGCTFAQIAAALDAYADELEQVPHG